MAIRKWYNVYSIFKCRATLNCREGYKDNMHGAYINLYLTEDEHIELDVDEEYLNIMNKRSRLFQEEAIFDMLYRKYPEMFDE